MILCVFLCTAQVLRLRNFEKYFFLVLCDFNRWLESDIMCVLMCYPGLKAKAF